MPTSHTDPILTILKDPVGDWGFKNGPNFGDGNEN